MLKKMQRKGTCKKHFKKTCANNKCTKLQKASTTTRSLEKTGLLHFQLAEQQRGGFDLFSKGGKKSSFHPSPPNSTESPNSSGRRPPSPPSGSGSHPLIPGSAYSQVCQEFDPPTRAACDFVFRQVYKSNERQSLQDEIGSSM